MCLIAVFLLFGAPLSKANAVPLRVFYAGFAFISDNTNIATNFKHSLKLSEEMDDDQVLLLEKELRSRVIRQRMRHFQLTINEHGDLDQGEGISVAFALDNETVAVEHIGTDYKIVIDLSAQILFFDFQAMKVIGCYPIAVQLIDASKQKPDDVYILERIRELYVGKRFKVNIFDEFANRLKDIEIKPKVRNSLQVGNVLIQDKALPFLPEAYRSNLPNTKTFLAQAFSKYLSSNQEVSILPYTKGYAIGNKMSARFANGEIYNLDIPEAQYQIDLTLRGFKKVLFAEQKVATTWIYGAYIDLKLFQPLLQKVYFDDHLKNGATKVVPAAQTTVEDWPAFQESLFVLFDSVTKKFSTDREYRSVNTILEACK